jgi:hypothetical protein
MKDARARQRGGRRPFTEVQPFSGLRFVIVIDDE